MDAATEFQPLTIEPDSMQFLESRRWQTNEIARMFGIPPHLVGDVEKSTSWGTGIETQNTGFVSYTIAGWTNRIEQRVSREVIATRKQFCEFDLDRLLRGSMSERFAAYTQGITAGWLTRNEARIKENMQPLDGLDDPIIALNMGPGDLEHMIPKTTQPAPSTEPAPGVGGHGIGGNQQ
jgi:HK97 family phage portal protein